MNDRIIIFGAGEWGKMAYYYYRTKCYIECFVDNSKVLCGTKIRGIKVWNPDILKSMDLSQIKIIVANKRQEKQIREQLFRQYGVCNCITFSLKEEVKEYVPYCDELGAFDECIIEYEGGLGNQMFQYALAQCFLVKGLRVTGDFSTYYNVGGRKFILEDIFPQIQIPKCNINLKLYYKANGFYTVEESILSLEKKETDIDVLNKERGYFEGYWQSFQYVQKVESELRRRFRFINKDDKKLSDIAKEIHKQNAVSIHIRRGDYLTSQTQRIFGNICTDEYYKKAIDYIEKAIEKPVYYYFSNDINWVKEKYKRNNAIYVNQDLFDDYEDWYDMYLMSVCKHNIIANSTFSWWGAWLNQNQNKVVIAPSKWVNGCKYEDIYPSAWIRL